MTGAMMELYTQGKSEVLGNKHYRVCVVDGWMCGAIMEWYKRGKLKYWERNIIQCWW